MPKRIAVARVGDIRTAKSEFVPAKTWVSGNTLSWNISGRDRSEAAMWI